MQLASILVGIVAILTLLVGVTVIAGAKPKTKAISLMFFLAVLGASIWGISVIVFLNLPENAILLAEIMARCIYISGILMVASIFGYTAWFTGYKWARTITKVLIGIGLVFTGIIIAAPDILYGDIVLSSEFGNKVILEFNWLYISYILFFTGMITTYSAILLIKILRKPPTVLKNITILLLVGQGICGVISLCFNLLLPVERYDLIWIGPLSVDFAIISFYYAILRYRLFSIRVSWMKMMSYVMLVATMALVYVVLLFVASVLLFRRAYIPTEELVLNFLMIVLVFAMMPVLSEWLASMRSLLSINTVDIGYIAKKLNHLSARGNVDLKELAVFLADHLHFDYVGLVVDDKLYGSKDVDFTVKDVEIGAVMNDNAPDKVWQILKGKEDDQILEHTDLRAIVGLRDTLGQLFGQIVFGAPHREKQFSEKDFLQLEMIASLIATTIEARR